MNLDLNTGLLDGQVDGRGVRLDAAARHDRRRDARDLIDEQLDVVRPS